MKNKHNKHHKPFHLHVEHFFRKQYVIYATLVLVAIGFVKADNRTLTIMHQAYAQEFHNVAEHMREETTRPPVLVNLARAATISGH